jgi:hypothetical protein
MGGMNMAGSSTSEGEKSSLALLKRQRSHVLFVLSNANEGCEATFLDWYQGAYRQRVSSCAGVLGVQHYEQHEVDITLGRYARLPFRYLGLYQLSLDGAQAADGLIELIAGLHRDSAAAQAPATWLYYPTSERVGRSPVRNPSMITVAFANGVVGLDAEFREWYATRHIRHALNIPVFVSGQCFELTQIQRKSALDAAYNTIAIYEQEGTPEEIIESCARLQPGTLDFPTIDTSRFAESVYRPVV